MPLLGTLTRVGDGNNSGAICRMMDKSIYDRLDRP